MHRELSLQSIRSKKDHFAELLFWPLTALSLVLFRVLLILFLDREYFRRGYFARRLLSCLQRLKYL